MPTTIKLKNSVTTTNAPSSLVQGEVAINVTDKKVWVGNAATSPVQLLGTGADASFTNLAYTGTLTGGTGVVNLGSGQVYKDASGNVGIGTSSPASKLDVITGTNSGIRVSDGTYTGTFVPSSLGGMAITTGGAYPLIYYINGSERMRIDSSGNVGIGTSSPTSALHVQRPNGTATYLQLFQTSLESWQIGMPATVAALTFRNSGTEQMRLDTSGNLMIGTTTSAVGGKMTVTNIGNGGIYVNQTSAGGWNYQSNAANLAGTFYHFQTIAAGTAVGGITSSSTTTSFNTTSDYRLKENVLPMTGALATVSALKPVTYTWKLDGSEGQGFIAHELQSVVPDAVTGEKDAVNEDGTIKPQGIDTSFLVATLTAALQEAHGLIKDLQARVEALESK